MMTSVDVVVAAHDPRRRVDRAVRSVLDGSGGDIRVTVVAHGVPATDFDTQLGEFANDERLRVVSFSDGVPSPAGPFSHGLALADAEYVALLGSDDFVEAGAVSAWLTHVRTHDVDYLIARLRNQNGALWRDPLTRPFRSERLDPVRDRLNYRAAPLGLIRRRYLESTAVGLTPGVATGEDIELGLALLNRGGRVDVGVHLPAYVIGADAPERTTLVLRPLAVELEALEALSRRDWPFSLTLARRRAIAIKLWRLNLIPAIVSRADAGLDEHDLRAVQTVAGWLRRLSGDAVRSLSRTEAAVAEAAMRDDAVGIRASVDHARRAPRRERVLTKRWQDALARDGMLRRSLRLRLPN